MKGKRTLVLIAVLIIGLTTVGVSLAVPGIISYQGKITNNTGTPLEGTRTMHFYLYDALEGGSVLWDEEQSVLLGNGIYDVDLGAVTVLDAAVFSGDEVYLEVRVYNTGTAAWETLTPRQRLTSTAYAYQAANADTLEGMGSAEFAAVSHEHAGEEITSGTIPEARIPGAIARDGEITWGNLTGIPGDIADGDQVGIVTETDPTVLASVKDGVSWGEVTGKPAVIGDITGVTAGAGLSGGGASGSVTMNVVFGGNGKAVTSSRSDHDHFGASWSGAGTALTLSSSSGDGVHVVSAGNPSSTIDSNYSNGIEVEGAEGSGLFVGTADQQGVHVASAGGHGIYVADAGLNGLTIDSANNYGLHVEEAGIDGLLVGSVDRFGVYVIHAVNGFDMMDASNDGLHVLHADNAGVYVEDAGAYGGYLVATDFKSRGVYAESSGDNGIGVFGKSTGQNSTGVYSEGVLQDFYAGGTGSYAPFTGSHEVRLAGGFPEDAEPGMIVSLTGRTEARKTKRGATSVSSTLPTVALSTRAGDKAVFGVLASQGPLPEGHWYKASEGERFGMVNAVGEGRVWVSNISGEIEAGDYITTSSIPGYGRLQDDDLLHSYTLGKATETVDWGSITETVMWQGREVKVYLIAVVYTSG